MINFGKRIVKGFYKNAMKRIFYFLILIVGVSLLATPVTNVKIDKKIWIRIDSLEGQGLYRSALLLVDKVYSQAKTETDPSAEIKALIYKLKYIQQLEEDGQLAAISFLEKELPDQRIVQGSLKYSMMAELYYRYFSANRWQISQNPIEEKIADQPVKKWSPERFYKVILENYELSLLKGDQLALIRVGSMPELWVGNLADTINKPALYDVLATRLLDFVENAEEFNLPDLKPSIFCSPDLFTDYAKFVSLASKSEGSASNPYYLALKWYGALLARADKTSLTAIDLRRLHYVHEQSCNVSRDSLYESGLVSLTEKLGQDSINAVVYEALAQYHLDRGNLFQINDKDTSKYSNEKILAAGWLSRSQKWALTLAGKRCQNLLNLLMKPELEVSSEFYQVPLTVFPVSIEYRNIKALNYKIFRMSALNYYTEWDNREPSERLDHLIRLKAIKSGKISLPDDGKLNKHRANAIIEPLQAGFYLMVFFNQDELLRTDKMVVTVPVSVSGTTLISRQAKSNVKSFFFRDRDSGSPLPGLSVVPWYSLYDQEARRPILEKGSRKISGSEGYLEIADGGPGRDDPSHKAYRLQIINKTDTLLTREMFYPGYERGKTVARTSLIIFTDRSLYKPGDEVFFRGVLIDYIGDSMAIHHADSVALKLQDSRYQVVGQMSYPVDSLGVFSGSVKLPYKGLTGNYLIHSNFGQAIIRMEQYRRPAFAISLMRSSEIFYPGDSISLSGKVTALSGEPVSGAVVSADIDIQPAIGPGRWIPFNGNKIRIATVKSTSNDKGLFTFRWAAIPEGSSPFGAGAIIRYSIKVKATDVNGETHEEGTNIDCGKGTTNLRLSISEKVLSGDSLDIGIGAYCSDGRSLHLPAKLRISKLKDPLQTWIEPVLPEPDRFVVSINDWQKLKILLPYKNEHLPSSWLVAREVYEKTFANDSASDVSIPPSGKWPKGWYKIELIPANKPACDPVVKYFMVEDPDPEKIENGLNLYARVADQALNAGQKLQLNFASSRKGFIMIDLQKSKGDPISVWFTAERKTQKMDWNVTRDWQGGAHLHLIMVASNRVYEENFPISVPWENSELNISGLEKITSVKPGDSVRLNLIVRDQTGAPARATLGITIYDASLDLINPHSWTKLTRGSFFGGPWYQGLFRGTTNSATLFESPVQLIDVPYIEPISLNWFGLGYYGISQMDAPVTKMAMAQPEGRRGGERSQRGEEDNAVKDAAGMRNVSEIEGVKDAAGAGSEIVIRSDFRETAFFKGNILSDKNGMAEVAFKVPEVFTEWKVMVTGHDRKLAGGDLEHHFKSAKELMLRPNFPEFMRKGDTVDFAARLGWYGKGQQNTVTGLKLTDISGTLLKGYPDVKSNLSNGQVVPFTWTYTAGKNEPIRYTLQSSSENQSDGVSDTINVYPDEVQLWNAQPFFFSKPGKKQLKIEGNPLEAVYEVTTTPAWQILQSLPVVNKNERDCSEYWFSRLYLTCLTGSIADKFPGVAEKFLSDSVPEKQRERVQQIRDWMNPDSRGLEMAYVLEKLSNLQNLDGTWPWYKGMGTDIFMTQQIIAGFGEMRLRGVFDVTTIQRGNYMVTRAVEEMDKWMYRQFRETIRLDSIHPQKVQLNPMVIHYLYARSFFAGLSLDPAHEIAWLYFNERIPLEWTQHDPGLQALMAISSVQLGRKAPAMPIYNSLRERAKTDEQWGMYWPRKGFASSWFNWDLWMQSRMIELFSCIEEGRKDLDQLKIYLIHQKRGRDWGNGMIAAWASKSLLFYGTSQSIQPASVGMTWGTEEYSALRIKTDSTGVTGYYRYEWKKTADMPKSRIMNVTQTTGGPAWGTLFTLDNYTLDNLSATGGPLNITREVMIQDGSGTWTVIKKGQTIKVGDRIRVRLDLKSDRELSYIEVRDNLGTGLMPVRVLSGYQYRQGLSYYQSREPESVVYNLTELPKGISTIEYQAIVEQAGSYFGGYATATSLYAPEFRAWSNSARIRAKR